MAEYCRVYVVGEIEGTNNSHMTLWFFESESEVKDYFTKDLCLEMEITAAIDSIIKHGTPHSSRKDHADMDLLSKLIDLRKDLRSDTMDFDGNLKEWQEKIKNPWEQTVSDLLFNYFWNVKQIYVRDDLVYWMCETIARRGK